MKKFSISIMTPKGKKFISDKVLFVNANLLEGEIGILANHTPLVSSLKISKLILKLENEEKIGVIHGGVFNVGKEEVSILTTNFEWTEEIDVDETQNEIKNIEYQLQSDVKEKEEESLSNRLKYANLKLSIL